VFAVDGQWAGGHVGHIDRVSAHPFVVLMDGDVDVLHPDLQLANSIAHSIRLTGNCAVKTTHAAPGSCIYVDVWLVPDPSNQTLAHNVCEFLSDYGVELERF
jgi:hypothetical protein